MFERLYEATRRCCIPTALFLCLAIILVGAAHPAVAQTSNPWTIQETVQSLKNDNTYALWIKKGTTDSQGNYSGDTASIWTVDATGHQAAISSTYGPYPGWRAFELVPAFDGTLRMAWIMDSGTTAETRSSILSVWTLDVSANRTSVSPTYGPYTGWQFQEIFPNSDGTSALYWVKTNLDSTGASIGDSLSIWTVDSVGSQLSISPTYGPYPGWYFAEGEPSFNKDGTVFVVWTQTGTYDSQNNYSGDTISVWKTDSRGNQTSIGPTYGPYPGWNFNELYPAYDGTARLLWTLPGTYDNTDNNYSGDTASVWSMDATGHRTVISPTYGPYPGWGVSEVVAAPSSTSRLLWVLPGTTGSSGNYTGDQASIWSLNAADVQTSISPTYTSPASSASTGGYVDQLTVLSDGSERLTWEYETNTSSYDYDSTQLLVWSLDASNNQTAAGPLYGPYP